jgi:hypothetical protein
MLQQVYFWAVLETRRCCLTKGPGWSRTQESPGVDETRQRRPARARCGRPRFYIAPRGCVHGIWVNEARPGCRVYPPLICSARIKKKNVSCSKVQNL